MKKIYISSILILFFSVFAVGQNLVSNGDLELWEDDNTPTGWAKFQNISKSTTAHDGSFSAAQTSASGTKKFSQLVSGIVGGSTYRISFWYLDNDASARTRLWASWKTEDDQWINDHDEFLHWNNYSEDNADWQEVVIELVAPANAAKFNFGVRTYKQDGNTGGQILFDDFSITDITPNEPILTITNPATDNYYSTSDQLTIDFNIINFNVATEGNGDGHIAYSLDGSETMKFDTEPIQLTNISVGEHQFIIRLVDDANQNLNPAIADTLNFQTFNNDGGVNLVQNGDVELWADANTLESWTKAENVMQETSNVHGGSYSVKQTADGTKDLMQEIAIIPGHVYELKYYYYDNDPKAKTRVWSGFRNANGWSGSDAARPDAFSTNQDMWVEFTASMIAPADADTFRLEVRTYNDGEGGGSVYLDDFSFIDLTTVGCKPITKSMVKLYPNPAKDFITIEDESLESIEICTLNGQVIKHIPVLNERETILISDLEKGIYLIKSHSAKETKIAKLIKL